jgi:molybdopterin molybdotransferase
MISVGEAKTIIREKTGLLSPVQIAVSESDGYVLAKAVEAPFNIPSFYQSSMDGYAFRFEDYVIGEPLLINGESAAGNATPAQLDKNTACRIFTGAPLPTGADTVVMQEKTAIRDSGLYIHDTAISIGQHVRTPGAEIRQGSIALEKGHVMNPASASYLSAIGIKEVSVYPLPVVTIIVTGNEFQAPGSAPQYGKVYESNAVGLKAALVRIGINQVVVRFAPDDLAATTNALSDAITSSDLVLLTGGVSVGEYDFVVAAAKAAGVEQHFHRIKQKPGKPLFFGTVAGKVIFGLPGNPSSVLTCFYEYVLEAIQLLTSRQVTLQTKQVRLLQSYSKPAGLTQFLKAKYMGDSVSALNAQESFRLASFATANCLMVAEETVTSLPAESIVEIHILP